VKKIGTKWIVVILAVVLIISGGLMAFSMNNQNDDDKTEVETKDMVELHTWFFTSGIPNNAIVVKHDDENVTFECIVDQGQFWVYDLQQYSKHVKLKPNNTIYWHGWENGSDEIIQHAFVDIILKVEDNIIGYAVIEIIPTTPLAYMASVLKSAFFPKVQGEYQTITGEQIANIVEQIKNK